MTSVTVTASRFLCFVKAKVYAFSIPRAFDRHESPCLAPSFSSWSQKILLFPLYWCPISMNPLLTR